MNQYVQSTEQFEFLPAVIGALQQATELFQRIIVVTNQQGIGKGLMTEEDLEDIHLKMQLELNQAGGKFDAIYHCPALAAENHPDRKPNTGMAQKALLDFPEISFEKSIMIGDSPSDIAFGKELGMKSFFLTQNQAIPENLQSEGIFKNLPDCLNWLIKEFNPNE